MGWKIRETMFELPARKADTCVLKEHRLSRAEFTSVNID